MSFFASLRLCVRLSFLVVGLAVLAVPGRIQAADGQYTLKNAESPPPEDLKTPVRDLMSNQAIQVSDASGNLYCEVWLRKSIPVKATAEQIKNGLTYREAEETTLLGAIRFAQAATDYRMQPIEAGVYTLRLGFQPVDGDHLGTALYSEFCLLVSARNDSKPGPLDLLDLRDLSSEAVSTSHPGVLLLFPNDKPGAAPQLKDEGTGHWVIKAGVNVDADGKPGKLGISLTIAGHSPAA